MFGYPKTRISGIYPIHHYIDYLFFSCNIHNYLWFRDYSSGTIPIFAPLFVYIYCLHICLYFLYTIFAYLFLQGNSSGTTAVCTFIRGKTIYAAWLGDSQAILVRNGQAVKIIEPHKPNRPVSKIVFFGIGVIFDLVLTG